MPNYEDIKDRVDQITFNAVMNNSVSYRAISGPMNKIIALGSSIHQQDKVDNTVLSDDKKCQLLLGCLMQARDDLASVTDKDEELQAIIKEINENIDTILADTNANIIYANAQKEYNKFMAAPNIQQNQGDTASKRNSAQMTPRGDVKLPDYEELKKQTLTMLKAHESSHTLGGLFMSKSKKESLEAIRQKIEKYDAANVGYGREGLTAAAPQETNKFLIKALIAESEKFGHSRFNSEKESGYKKGIESLLTQMLGVNNMDEVKRAVNYTGSPSSSPSSSPSQSRRGSMSDEESSTSKSRLPKG